MMRPRHLMTCYQKSNDTAIHVKCIQKLMIKFYKYLYGLSAPIMKKIFTKRILKGCVRYIFASLFLGLNESTCQLKKNVFYFTSEPLFVLEKIKF